MKSEEQIKTGPTHDDVLLRVAEYSSTLAAESGYYWKRHERRYRHMARVLARVGFRGRGRILDIGMGYETLILRGLFPEAVVDCLGIVPDGRFLPGGEGAFFTKDLNEPESGDAVPEGAYDLIVFMEVLEHLCVPPDVVLAYLRRLLVPGGLLLLTTPNAVWLKNRLKMLCGRNPFELLRADPKDRGHIREYTGAELVGYVAEAGLELGHLEACGLYCFDNRKDNFYSWLADHCHPSLSRSLVLFASRPL